jgi:hypothetical protein
MSIHFEELWVQCENLQKDIIKDEPVSTILDELLLKIGLYRALDRQEIPSQDRDSIKSRTMGEILLTLTKLSMKDNVNVYEALNTAMQYRSIDHFQKKYAT